MARTALVVGTSGIVGSATAALLIEQGWTVYGLARRPSDQPGVHPVAADLTDAAGTAAALAPGADTRRRQSASPYLAPARRKLGRPADPGRLALPFFRS